MSSILNQFTVPFDQKEELDFEGVYPFRVLKISPNGLYSTPFGQCSSMSFSILFTSAPLVPAGSAFELL